MSKEIAQPPIPTPAEDTKVILRRAFYKAAHSRPIQTFLQWSGRVSGYSALAGDALLGFQYVLPATLAVASDVILSFSDFGTTPELRQRIERVSGFLGASAVAALAYESRNDPEHVVIATSCGMMALQPLSLMFQDALHALSKATSNAQNFILRKGVSPVTKYPVLATTALDMAGQFVLAAGAIQTQNFQLLAVAGLWTLSNLGLMGKDKNVLRKIEAEKPENSHPKIS